MSHASKPYRVAALVAACLFTLSPVLCAGSLSAAEKDVWSTVEAYWAEWGKGNVDGFLGHVHADYVGWSTDAPLPTGKESSRKWMSFWASSHNILVYEVTPASVIVHGEVAIVHYYFSYAYKDDEGKVKDNEGRWTDILIKDGGRWVLFADHGGSTKDDD